MSMTPRLATAHGRSATATGSGVMPMLVALLALMLALPSIGSALESVTTHLGDSSGDLIVRTSTDASPTLTQTLTPSQSAGVETSTVVAGEVPAGLTPAEWSSVQTQIAARTAVSSASVATERFRSAPGIGAAISVPLVVTADTGIAATLLESGASITSASSATPVVLTTTSVGNVSQASAAVRTSDGVAFDRGIVDEWFESRVDGIEHGFTITEPISLTNDLAITVAVANGVPSLVGPTSAIITRDDGSILHYRGLHSYDADGTVLASFMSILGGTIVLNVDTTDAAYPITVDPIISEDEKLSGSVAAGSDALLGASVSIDGNRMAVGVPGDDGVDAAAGSVQIFERGDATSPWFLSDKIASEAGVTDSSFGSTVALLGDRVAVGVPDVAPAGTEEGLVYIFEYDIDTTTWPLLGSGKIGQLGLGHDRFGDALAFVDQDTLAIGAPDSRGVGDVYLSTFDGSEFAIPVAATATAAGLGDEFGYSIATTTASDGDRRLVVGSPGDDDAGTDAGAVYIFDDGGAGFELIDKEASDVFFLNGDRIGTAVAASRNSVAAAGIGSGVDGDSYNVHLIEEVGASYTVTYSFSSALSLAQPITTRPNEYLTMIGRNLLVGRPGGGGQVGIFRDVDGSGMALVDQLQPAGRQIGDSIGYAIDIDGATLVVGAIGDDDAGTDNGAVYSAAVALTGTYIGTDGDYDNPANWDIGSVPGQSDTAIIPPAAALVTVTGTQNIGLLVTQSIDTLRIDGELAIAGVSSGATQSSITGGIEVNGRFVLDTNATASIAGSGTFDINGTLGKTGDGTFNVGNGISWNSNPGSVIDVQSGTLSLQMIAIENGRVVVVPGARVVYADNGSLEPGGIYDIGIGGPSTDPANYGVINWGSANTSISGTISTTLFNGYFPTATDDYPVVLCSSGCFAGSAVDGAAPLEAVFNANDIRLVLPTPAMFTPVIDIDGEWAAVGVPGADAVFVLRNLNGVWTDVQTVTSGGALPNFGAQVALAMPFLAVADPDSDVVRVFEHDGINFVQAQEVAGIAGEEFGRSMDASGTRLIVGAPLNDIGAVDAGRVVAYDMSDLATGLPELFTVTNEGAGDQYGYDVAATPGDFWASVPFDDDAAGGGPIDGGTVRRLDNVGATTATVRPLAPAAGTFFGLNIDADEGRVVATQDAPLVGGASANLEMFDVGSGQQTIASSGVNPYSDVVISGDLLHFRIDAIGQTATMSDDGSDGNYGQINAINGANGVAISLAADGGQLMQSTDIVGTPTNGLANTTFTGFPTTASRRILPAIGSAGDQFGSNVAMEGDTMVIGAALYDSELGVDKGALYIFEAAADGWFQTQIISDTGFANVSIGTAVAVDGNTLVAAQRNNGFIVYERTSLGAAFVAIAGGTQPSDGAVRSVAIEGDTLVIGMPDVSGGQVNIYTGGPTGWISTPPQVIGAPGLTGDDTFGHQVDISGDRIAIGAPASGSFNGPPGELAFAETWTRPDGASPFAIEQRVNSAVLDDFFGWSVALDGNYLAVGAPRNGAGVAYLYDIADGFSSSLFNDGLNNSFGYALALDSGVLVVGDFSSTQRAYNVYTGDLITSLVHDAFEPGDNTLGSTPVATSNGRTVFGARLEDFHGRDAGSAYAYFVTVPEPPVPGQILAGDGAAGDFFGQSVAIHDDFMVVGARSGDGAVADSGSAYVFERNPGEDSWNFITELTADDANTNAWFGYSVAVAGSRFDIDSDLGSYVIAVGAPNILGGGSGAVYMYRYDLVLDDWVQTEKIPAGAGDNTFGLSIDLEQRTIASRNGGYNVVIGAPDFSGAGDSSVSLYNYIVTEQGGFSDTLTFVDRVTGPSSGDDRFGFSVAIDGDTVVVGAREANVGSALRSGEAYVYRIDAANNLALEATLNQPAGDEGGSELFGHAVDVDHDVAVVTAFTDNTNGAASGAAFVYERTGTTWSAPIELTGSGQGPGNNVGLNARVENGVVVVSSFAGGPNDGGSVSAFQNVAGNWPETQVFVRGDAQAGEGTGSGLALGEDGVLVIGSAEDDNAAGANAGSVQVFDTAIPEVANKINAQASPGDRSFLGAALDIDGNWMIVGEPQSGFGPGKAHLFEFIADQWMYSTELVDPDGVSGIRYGNRVAIDGDWAAVTKTGEKIALWHRVGATWVAEETIAAPDPQIGLSLAIDGDNERLILGRPEGTIGVPQVYDLQTIGAHVANTVVVPAEIENGERFGTAVAISGDVAYVSAPADDNGGALAIGTVHVFLRTGTVWNPVNILTDGVTSANAQFGGRMDLDGSRLIVGSSPRNVAVIFELLGTSVSSTIRLSSPGASRLGTDVAISGNVAIAGANGARVDNVLAGSAVTFTFDGTTWTETDVFTAADREFADAFGTRVALNDTSVVVGAIYDTNDGGVQAGALYTYDVVQPVFAGPSNKVVDPTPVIGDRFGTSVAVADDVLIVGSPQNADNGPLSGKVNVFERQADGSWLFATELSDPTPADGARFGRTLALAGDRELGEYVAAVPSLGSPTSVELFQRTAGAWASIGSVSGDVGTVGFGTSIDIDLVGPNARIAIGATGTTGVPGTVSIFNVDTTTSAITALSTLTTSIAPGADNAFGYSIAIDGDTVVAGAVGVNGFSGAAAVFSATDASLTDWNEDAVLTFCEVAPGSGGAPPTTCPGAGAEVFGVDLDISGNTIAVGASGAAGTGAVNVYQRNGAGTWSLQTALPTSTIAAGANLGFSVAANTDVIAAGAPESGSIGSVVTWRNLNGEWVEESVRRGLDSTTGDRFGEALSLSGDGILVAGAPVTQALGVTSAGAAYSFKIALVDTPSLTFDFDLAAGSPTSINVAPTGIAVTAFDAEVVDDANEDATTVAASPLSTIDLDDTPLSTITVGQTPLSTIVLGSVPLSTIPIINIDVDGGWSELLAGTDLENVPLQDLTFGQALSNPVVNGRIQALPLSTINVQGTPLSTIPLSTIALGNTPLSTIPLSTIDPTLDWCDLIAPYFPAGTCTTEADLVDVTLMEATLAGTPLSTIPLSTIPLSTIPLSTIPLSTIPLSTIDFRATPLSTIPLSTIPLSTIGLDATPLSTIPLSTIPLSTIPLSAIPLSTIDVNGSPLSTIPLSTIGIEGAPLSTIPMAIPLSTIPLSTIDPAGTPLSTIPLSTIVLADAPLSTIPLSTIDGTPLDWCELLARTDDGVDCDHGIDPATTTLAELSVRGVPLSTIPLSTIPLSTIDLVGAPLSTIPLSTIPLSTISLEALPLSTIDLQGTPLSTIDPTATPLSTIPLSTIPLSTIDIVGSPLSTIPLSTIDIAGSPLSTIPLSTIPLSTIPLSTIPLSTIDIDPAPLSTIPLSTIPLSTIDLIGSPLSTIPLSTIPLNTIDIDCTLVNCDVDTLGDAAAAGAIDLTTATLLDLQPALSGLRLSDLVEALPSLTAAILIAALQASGLQLGDLPGLDDVTLGELPPFLAAFANMTLADLEGALFAVSLGDLIGALLNPATGLPYSNADATAALEQAIAALGLTVGDVDALGDATLGDLLNGGPDLTLADLGPLLGFISVQSIIDFLDLGAVTVNGTLGDLDPAELGNLLLVALFGNGATAFDTLELGEFLQDLDAQGLLEGFTLGDLLLALVGADNLPFGGFDFTDVEVGQLPAGTVPNVGFEATFDVQSSISRSVEVTIDLPGTATYVPGTSVVSSGFPLTPSPLEPVVTENQLTWTFTSVVSNDNYSIDFDVLPTVSLGRTALKATARVLGTDVVARGGATVRVAEGLENNDFPPPFVTPVADDTIYLTYISNATDIDVFEIAVQDNDRLVLELSNLDADLDVAVYVDPADDSVGTALSDVSDNRPVFPLTDPDQDGTDAEPLEDFPRLDEIDPNLQLIAVSNSSDLENEFINTDRLPAGTYYIQVFGANGAVNTDPAALQIQLLEAENRPECQATGPLPAVVTGVAPSLATSANTLILLNESRLEQLHGAAERAAITTKLTELATFLAANPQFGIDPIVVPVDGFAGVRTAYDAWDDPVDPEFACDPERANAVVAAINANIVDPLRDQLTHVLIVGGDDQIPMARLDDATQVANEYDFRHEFDGDLSGANPDGANAFTSAFWERRFLSDEPYGEAAAQSLGNRYLYVSDLALGRLVEDPADIVNSLDHFIQFDGTLDVSSATVLGYDFLTDGSEEIAADLAAAGLPVDDKYADGEDNGVAWDRIDAENELADAGSNELISLNAHFDHYRALPAVGDQVPGFDDNLIATEVEALLTPDLLTQSLIFSMGCHSGLAVPDTSIAQTNEDWAQSIARTGGIFVANTGFGYGDTEAVAYTERLMANFAEQAVNPVLLDGATAPTTIGQALTFAKNDYSADLSVFSVYDEKALMESTFYGIPFYQVGSDGVPAAPAPDNTTVADTTGTQVLNVNIQATNDQNDTPSGTYFSNTDDDGTERTIVAPGRPIQPSARADVSVVEPANTTDLASVAHGAIVLGMSSTYLSITDPVVATPIFDESVKQPEPGLNNVTFPTKPTTINRSTGPTGERQALVVATGQYRSNGTSQRLDDDIDVAVYYAPTTVTDFRRPTIGAVTSTLAGGLLTVTLSAADAAGVNRVYLLVAENPGTGNVDWAGLDLVNTGGNSWSGSLQVDPATTTVEFLVQAKDANGNVGVAANKASNFSNDVEEPTPPVPTPDLDVTVDDTLLDAASGWYTGTTSVTVDSGDLSAEYTIDGSAAQPVPASGTFEVTGDGVHIWTVTTENGQTSTGIIRIDGTLAPIITLGTPVDNGIYDTGTAVYDVLCTDPSLVQCVLSLSGAEVANGDALPAAVGNYVLDIQAVDALGNTAVRAVPFEIIEVILPGPPSIIEVTGPTDPTSIDDGVEITATFDDPQGDAPGSVYAVEIDWGDADEDDPASTSTVCAANSLGGVVTTADGATCEISAPNATPGTVLSTFTYADPGVYSVTVTIADETGNVVSETYEYVVVYDPDGGRVTGSGWFLSGADAYPDGPWYPKFAKFGFNARYKTNATTPTGKTRLKINGEFKFTSVSYDYLVINDSLAVAEGVGEIGSDDGYRFRVQAVDNGVFDFIQISIWDDATGEIFYDNGVIWDAGDLVLWGGIKIRP